MAADVASDAVVDAATQIGPGVSIGAGAVVGRAPRLSQGSSARRQDAEPCRLAAGAAIGAGAIVLAGASIGEGATVAAGAFVRERARIGAGSTVGQGAAVDNDVVVGERVTIGAGAYLTAGSLVEDGVSVGAGVVTTNDDTMSRHPPGIELRGATLRRDCTIGDRAVLVPGVQVGPDANVAADAVVTRDVPEGAQVAGVPAGPGG